MSAREYHGPSSWLASVLQYVDLRDRARGGVDGEANLVHRIDTVQQRGGIGLVTHRHGLHEVLDLPVLQDDLLLLRTQGDDRALPRDELGLGLQLRVLA